METVVLPGAHPDVLQEIRGVVVAEDVVEIKSSRKGCFSLCISQKINTLEETNMSMKTIFDQEVREELIQRINGLNEDAQAQWGTMNLYQMMKHCTNWEKWMQGKGNPPYKQGMTNHSTKVFRLPLNSKFKKREEIFLQKRRSGPP